VITTRVDGAVGVITLDRHERRNALDVPHLRSLLTAVTSLTATCRALVITGAGSSFCAGADTRGVYGDDFRPALYALLRALTDTPVPVLAAVNGPAIGAGTQLAIACDLRVVAPTAVFAVPTARNGLAVDPWTIRRLALLAGGGAARALLLGADRIDAELALHRGLADRPGGVAETLAWAAEIAGFVPESLRYAKNALDELLEPRPWPSTLDTAFDACWQHAQESR
jgi:enoyl-CoA hydratase